jgi:cob(I)alamin adenosyltransferase
MTTPTDRERLDAVERWARHLARRLDALDRKLAGVDQNLGALLRDARQRLRRLERLLGG